MKMKTQRIERFIMNILQELNEVIEERITEPLDNNTKIFGRNGLLDSMDLVSLIVDLEKKIEDEFGISLIIADERAMSEKKSPFRTVLSLAEYICALIEEEKEKGVSL